MSTAAIPILNSIEALAPTCDAWIVDIWGVMHNGVRAFRAAGEACARFRAAGGIVVLLSNAPRPFGAVVGQMNALGVDPAAYDGGVTSGDATRAMIAARADRPLLHIGPQRDLGLFSGLGVPMICANPDLVVERGDKLVYCAGSLAAAYAERGGEVLYAGKPHLPIYERTFDVIEELAGARVPKERMLAIGDGVETDLKGAHAAGLRSLFIASAVHVPGSLDEGSLGELFA